MTARAELDCLSALTAKVGLATWAKLTAWTIPAFLEKKFFKKF